MRVSVLERSIFVVLLIVGLVAAIYFAGDWPPEFYWGRYGYHSPHFHCPACGGATALYNLVRGNFALAWQYNQLFILSLPMLIYGVFLTARAVVTGHLARFPMALIWIWVGAVIIFFIARNIPLDVFSYIRPPS